MLKCRIYNLKPCPVNVFPNTTMFAGRVCRTNLPGSSTRHVCKTHLPDTSAKHICWSAGQSACRTRLPDLALISFFGPALPPLKILKAWSGA